MDLQHSLASAVVVVDRGRAIVSPYGRRVMEKVVGARPRV